MSRVGAEVRLGRLLVALDASAASLGALEAAAGLAAALEAELVGLFVEDEALVALAAHPAARHFDAASAAPRAADEVAMRGGLRALAARARRAFDLATRGRRLRGTFRVVRGRVAPAVVAAAADADLVCVGRTGWSATRARLGSTARAVLASDAAAVLLVPEGGRVEGPFAVVVDGSAGAARAVAAAARLAGEVGGRLVVLLSGPDPEALERSRREVAAWGLGAGPAVEVHAVAGRDAGALLRAARATGVRTLVVAATSLDREPGGLSLLERLPVAWLVVR